MPKPRQARLSNYVQALELIWKKSEGVWIRVPAFQFKGTHAQLKHWGLLEDQRYQTREGEERTRSGVWRVTHKGQKFIEGVISQPAELTIILDDVISESITQVTFEQALAISKSKNAAKSLTIRMQSDEGDRLFLAEQVRLAREDAEADDN